MGKSMVAVTSVLSTEHLAILLVAIAALACPGCSRSEPAGADKIVSEAVPVSKRPIDYTRRLGVVSVNPKLLQPATQKLPFGFYKNYTSYKSNLPTDKTNLGFMPVIQYKAKTDSAVARQLVTLAWNTNQIPKLPGITLQQMLVAMDRGELENWLIANAHSFERNCLFLLGNEPGFRPNNDDRSAQEIVADAKLIVDMFRRNGLSFRLALGGISTPKNEHTIKAYAGVTGDDFLREILDAAQGTVDFDGFVIHPYPSNPSKISVEDSIAQIVTFRKTMQQYGLQNKPLIVGEVGVPFAAAEGQMQQICSYAEQLIAYCLTATDEAIGNPLDDNRLIQRIVWYLLAPPEKPIKGFSDNPALDLTISSLLTSQGELTELGMAVAGAVDRLPQAAAR